MDPVKITNFIKLYEKSFIENWDLPALTDYVTKKTMTYGDVASAIAKIHLFFESAGLKRGDKVAICGKDSVNWVLIYMATVTYGGVIVPILSEFNPKDVTHIVNHSEARLFFVSHAVWEPIEPEALLNLQGALLSTTSISCSSATANSCSTICVSCSAVSAAVSRRATLRSR